MKKKDNELKLLSLGGCSEIGMNLYAYMYKDQWILVDMGMGFSNKFGQELIVPSPVFLMENKSKIKALFITHSHEDHIGAIPYLWPMIECPVYARPFALEMIKDRLYQFEMDNKVPLIRAAENKEIKIGDFSVKFIPVAHSTPESSALIISTPAGNIVHSGDWRTDDEPVLDIKANEDALKEIGDKGVSALICDSTNVFREEQFITEKNVRENLIELVKKQKKHRVLVTCFASNVARLESCYYAAQASGRQLVVVGRSLKKIERVARATGYLKDVPAFLDEKKANSLDPGKVLIVCTGSQGETNSALSKIAFENHKTVSLDKGDVLIFSSRVIPGNERVVLNVQNALAEKGIRIITNADCDIHASGHPSRQELHHLYNLVRPQTLIPIHGEKIHLYKHQDIAKEYGIKNVIVPTDGSIIRLTGTKPEIIDTIECEMLAVEGHNLLPISGTVYKEREMLSNNGVVSLCIKNTKGIVKMVDFSAFGVFEKDEDEEIAQIKDAISSELNLSFYGRTVSPEDLAKATKKIVGSVFLDIRGKKPVIILHQL